MLIIFGIPVLKIAFVSIRDFSRESDRVREELRRKKAEEERELFFRMAKK